MARVTLVNPNRMKPAVSPIALDYLGDALDSAGHEVDILDMCFSCDWRADIAGHFRRTSPSLVGISIRNTDDCYFASRDDFMPGHREVVREVRRLTDARIVLGGAGLSTAPGAALEFVEADFAVAGEGEIALPALASALEGRKPLESIPGLIWKDGGAIRANAMSCRCPDGRLPRSRRWIDNARYFREGGQAGIETKRGCSGQCIYCADPAGKGSTARLQPPERVADEVQEMLRQGIDCFHLCDSEFNMPLSHALAVCRELAARGLGERIRWYTYASPAPFTDELAGAMKRAGCAGIDIGADSGDDGMLRSLGRAHTSEDLLRTADICRRHGIVFMYDLLLGGPGETRESVARTIEVMKKAEADRVGVSLGVRIYDGTALAEMVRREGFSTANPALHGQTEGNDGMLAPVFYLSPALGEDAAGFVQSLVGDDTRFLIPASADAQADYNYNENDLLVQAIRDGYRGAYWDILRRVSEGVPPA